MDWESTAYESKSPKDIKYPEAKPLPLSRDFPQMFKNAGKGSIPTIKKTVRIASDGFTILKK